MTDDGQTNLRPKRSKKAPVMYVRLSSFFASFDDQDLGGVHVDLHLHVHVLDLDYSIVGDVSIT